MHSPTYILRVIRRSLKHGLKFRFFTSNVSNMSNTGIAYICTFANYVKYYIM